MLFKFCVSKAELVAEPVNGEDLLVRPLGGELAAKPA
jgi:hypothetical protein